MRRKIIFFQKKNCLFELNVWVFILLYINTSKCELIYDMHFIHDFSCNYCFYKIKCN